MPGVGNGRTGYPLHVETLKTGVWSAPAVPRSVPELRTALYEFASDSVPDPPLADMRLAVSEALTNAVLHGYRESDTGEVAVHAELGRDELRIVVSDAGVGFSPRTDSPGLGLGMRLMQTVADDFEIRSGAPGTEIHMSFQLTH